MNLVKNRYVFLGLSVLAIIDVINTFSSVIQELGLHNTAELPWDVFYYAQLTGTNETNLHFLAFLGLFPIVIAWILIYQKNSQLDNYVLTRLDRQSYILKQGKQLFTLAVLYKLLLTVLELAIIGFSFGHLGFNFHFNVDGAVVMYFSQNAFIQTVAYVIFSAIGWGVWALFIYSICLFVTRTILIIPLSYMAFFICVVVPLLVARLHIPLFYKLGFVLSLNNVVAPGLLMPHELWGSMFIYATLSLIVYVALTITFFKLYIKRAEQGLGE